MDTSYLTSQVANIIAQLHGLFDEIGVPNHERESREAELFQAVSESLHNHLRMVSTEKNDMTEEASRLIKTIKQMETSLDDTRTNHDADTEDPNLRVTYPLLRCLQTLKQKHATISKLHRERFEQVKQLVQALESYSSHLEPSFVRIELPPTSPDASVPTTFDLSPTYVTKLDQEFTRVFEAYTRRINTVRETAEEVVRLWAELGTPQAQTDGQIVKSYKDTPEQLGLHEADIQRLTGMRKELARQRSERDRKLKELRTSIETLWDRLGVEQSDRKRFLNANRGCGLRVMNEYEDELARLNELKRQNLHLFVEDARYKLQELWDSLYFSEEEMLEFTPAFSDVYSDALLSSHEAEIARLEALKEQRGPILQMIERYRSLVKDREDLSASSQDASRLMLRGQKGERRDPTRLLREEKMRKRIAKELPKIEADLRKSLDDWEDEYGRPFCVLGERYLDELAACARAAPPPRAKTPSVAPPSHKSSKSVPSAYSSQLGSSFRGQAPPPMTARSGAKTPTGTSMGTVRRNPLACSTSSTMGGSRTPSKIPARMPLGNMPHGNNSPERGAPAALARAHTYGPGRKLAEPAMAPPPKMRNLVSRFAPPAAPTPGNGHDNGVNGNYQYYEHNGSRSESAASSQESVRNIPPEDIYGGEDQQQAHHNAYRHLQSSTSSTARSQGGAGPYSSATLPRGGGGGLDHSSHHQPHHQHHQQPHHPSSHNHQEVYLPPRSENRQISTTSSTSNAVSGSENWETYDDASDPEPEVDASDAYYTKLRAAARVRRFTPEPTTTRTTTAATATATTAAATSMMHGQLAMNTSSTNTHHTNYNSNGTGIGSGIGSGSGGSSGGSSAMQPAKKIKGIRSPNPHASTKTMIQGEGGRMIVVSGSDAGWTDEDHF